MSPLVEFPLIVQYYAPWEVLVQFQRYLSGLIISENKTVGGHQPPICGGKPPSRGLNRLLTASPYSQTRLPRQRIALLDSLAGTRVKPKGELSVDDTLQTHSRQHYDQIAYLYDPVDKRSHPPPQLAR